MGTDIFYIFVIKYTNNFLIKPIRSWYFMAAYYIKKRYKVICNSYEMNGLRAFIKLQVSNKYNIKFVYYCIIYIHLKVNV